jgi:hypothetical protein
LSTLIRETHGRSKDAPVGVKNKNKYIPIVNVTLTQNPSLLSKPGFFVLAFWHSFRFYSEHFILRKRSNCCNSAAWRSTGTKRQQKYQGYFEIDDVYPELVLHDISVFFSAIPQAHRR